jgi:CheY-like chemotaxis protein
VKKVLVIDDETSTITYLTTLLEDHGYATCAAQAARQGLELARAQRPDLICLDIMMPKRSGIALYRDLKRDPELQSIPTIFVSAFSGAEDFLGTHFRKLIPEPEIPEPLAFLEKPIEPCEFVEIVVSLIGPGVEGSP